MHVTVSSTFPAKLRPLVEGLVKFGFTAVESGDVEVHVKARARVRRQYVAEFADGDRLRFRRRRDAEALVARYGGVVWSHTSRHPRASGWSGRTYDGVPGIARVTAGTRYLVTMNIPARPQALTGYPRAHQDPRLKTSPVVVFDDWTDELIHLAAHEARHVHQFRHRLRRSELDAERWAARVLATWQEASAEEAPAS